MQEQVADEESGAGSLAVELQSTISDAYSSLDWGAFTPMTEVRKRQLVAGADAKRHKGLTTECPLVW